MKTNLSCTTQSETSRATLDRTHVLSFSYKMKCNELTLTAT
jgi:hypothetical protein